VPSRFSAVPLRIVLLPSACEPIVPLQRRIASNSTTPGPCAASVYCGDFARCPTFRRTISTSLYYYISTTPYRCWEKDRLRARPRVLFHFRAARALCRLRILRGPCPEFSPFLTPPHFHMSSPHRHISTSDATSILLCFCAATPSCLRLTTLPPCHVFTSLHRRLLLTFPLHSLHSTPSTRHMVFTFYGKIIYSLHFIDLFYRLYPPAPIR